MLCATFTLLLLLADIVTCAKREVSEVKVSNNTAALPFTLRETVTDNVKAVSTSQGRQGELADTKAKVSHKKRERGETDFNAVHADTLEATRNSTDTNGSVYLPAQERQAGDLSTTRNSTDTYESVLHPAEERQAGDLSTTRNTTDTNGSVYLPAQERQAGDLSTTKNSTDTNESVYLEERQAGDLSSASSGSGNHCKDNVTITLSDLEGVIDWSEANTSTHCTWFIHTMTSHPTGLVLQFDDVCLQRGTTADDDDSVVVTTTTGEVLRHVTGCLPVSPVLVHSPNATVTVINTWQNESRTETTRDSAASDVSRFTLRYTAYPAVSLPPQLPSGQYNCSPPYVVPEALRCDMAEQCLGGEDERNSNCSYHSAGCGDWLPYGDLCLQFVFPSTAISPLSAASRCEQSGERHALAALHDPEGKRLAAIVTSLSGFDDLIVGLKKKDEKLGHLYRFLWSWEFVDTLEPEGPDLSLQRPSLNCVTLRTKPVVHFQPVYCSRKLHAGFACIKTRHGVDIRALKDGASKGVNLAYPAVSRHRAHFPVKTCSDGSFVHSFEECPYNFPAQDVEQAAVQRRETVTRRFQCSKYDSIRYSYTCDGQSDCTDDTDEFFCFRVNDRIFRDVFFKCKKSREVRPVENRCDGKADCWDASDEDLCRACSEGTVYFTVLGCLPESYVHRGLHNFMSRSTANVRLEEQDSVRRIPTELTLNVQNRTSELRVLTMDGYGTASLYYSQDGDCPETHYLCPRGLCIPTYLLNNDENDCPFPSRVDEKLMYSVINLPCPGHYRCRRSQICVHPDHVCDGVYHCPSKDDERYCGHACPDVCVCEGFEYTCTHMFDHEQHPLVHYLDLSHSPRPELDGLVNLHYLRFLNVSFCQLKEYPQFNTMTIFRVLDLSFNLLTSASLTVIGLTHLNLTGNPLVDQLTSGYMGAMFNSTSMYTYDLRSLSLAQSGLRHISDRALLNLSFVTFLDVSGNGPVRFGKESLLGLGMLQRLRADDQRLCCAHAALYPNTYLTCEAPVNELSSCSDLLRSVYLRVMLWLQAAMAVTGNVGVFVFRVFRESQLTSSSFSVLVTHLCVADFLMGVYMVIIGAADARYSGQYLWARDDWTESDQCKAAGFLALLSSEVSAFIICLITLDRFLVLRFPFQRGLHMTSRSAMLACGAVWGVGVALAVVPLLPFTQHWQFYGQTGICLPLPITRRQFPGQAYSFAVFIGLNFVLFLLIGAGQLSIFLAVHSTPAAGRTQRRQQDMAIARRLFLIVLTDLCCWLPVGVMGLLATRGVPIPGELNVWTAVFVLPLNSALNPFLYTLNTLRERGKKRREEKRMARVMDRLRAELVTWPDDKLEEHGRFVLSLLKRSSGGRHSPVNLNGVGLELVQSGNDVNPVQ